MSIIEKYKEKKENKTPIHLVINSFIDYKDHDLNVLKECLNKWSEIEEYARCGTIAFSWIYTNIQTKDKMYFINTNKEQLARHSLLGIIDNPDINANLYMDKITQKVMFYNGNNNF